MKVTLWSGPVFIFLVCFLSGCFPNKHITNSDYSSINHFDQYNSFKINNNIDLAIDYHAVINKTLSKRLYAMGYVVSDEDPCIYILYKIYDKDFKIENLHQTKLENWLALQNSEEDIEKQTTSTTKVKANSFFVTFYDPKLNRVVWRAYIGNIDFANEREFSAMINQLMDEYQVVAYPSNNSPRIALNP